MSLIGQGVEVCTSTTRPTTGVVVGTMIYETDTASYRWASAITPSITWIGMIPVGTVQPYAGSTAPAGWLLCEGNTTYNASTSTQYADLYAVIGNTYGGTNNTNFKLPDLRGRVPGGKDDIGGSAAGRLDWATTLGTPGGAQYHTLSVEQLASHTHAGPSHTHAFTTGTVSANHTHSQYRGVNTGYRHANDNNNIAYFHTYDYPQTGTISANHTHSGTTNSDGTGNTGAQGSGSAHNNMQPTLLLNYIIKY